MFFDFRFAARWFTGSRILFRDRQRPPQKKIREYNFKIDLMFQKHTFPEVVCTTKLALSIAHPAAKRNSPVDFLSTRQLYDSY
jgi:hypothetical protein